ncbi:hypothetical protein [Xanthocytophaga flava]|uniref:hypothetical protein n=1 Tax=Xanthocytophaga flava TaxID=3048013 RepID=UPI0028D1F8A4|nr:hypothetical protein [Xanthocytophaga flavus]MDJ1470872.1 hypothetical protein [Xanthocytophaga flavus]
MKTVVRFEDPADPYVNQGTAQFKRIYGLGGKGDVVMSDTVAYLPLSLHADSVTYIFEGIDGTIDTLVLCYNRNFGPYKGDENRCGYGADFSGDYVISGSNDTTHVVGDSRYYGASRTTFSYGYAEYRNNVSNWGPIQNIYAVTLYKKK